MKSRTSTAAVKMILMLGMGLVSGSVAHAGGLRCSFGEVMIENLTIGSSNSLERIAALPLTLTNSGDRSVTVDIQPTIPAGSELRYGAQPIPDLSWVALTRSSVALDAQESVQVDITLHIPNDGKYVGGKYQVNVWSHTQAQPGELVAIGLTSRVIFTVSKQSDTESVGTPGASVALVPAEVTLRGVGLGQTFSLQTDLDRSLVLKNPSARPVTVELNALHPADTRTGLQPGFGDLLAVAALEFTPERLVLEPGEEARVEGTISFARGTTFPERTMIGIIRASVVGPDVTTAVYARIYVPAP